MRHFSRNILVLMIGVILLATPLTARAHEAGPLGLGIILGEPSGLSMKVWLDDRNAFDAAAAWSFTDEDALHLHGDYLLHFFNRVDVESGRLPLYVGVGGRIKFNEDDSLIGVRIPFGVNYLFQSAPLDLFLEVVPILDVAPESDVELNAAIGTRYYS